jgi:hypothetical protein
VSELTGFIPAPGLLRWLLRPSAPHKLPAVQDLATQFDLCVTAGCLDANDDELTVLDLAAHAGGHSPGGRLSPWVRKGLERAQQNWANEVRDGGQVLCHHCGMWWFEANFEAINGCCAYKNAPSWPRRRRGLRSPVS